MSFFQGLTSTISSILSPNNSRVDPTVQARIARYDYLWSFETSSVFTAGQVGGPPVSAYSEVLKSTLRLYRNTRLVWNPFPTLTDFWANVIYPGVLTRDGLALPDGTPSAIPFPEDTNPGLIAAAVQIWSWSNMQAQKTVIPHWAAIAGNVLIEIVDDVAGEKITLVPRWAGVIKEIELSPAGDVNRYLMELTATDPNGREYKYGQEVTKDTFRTFRDGKPFDYTLTGQGSEWDNVFGFVPACWVPHRPGGGTFGVPAIGSAIPELLEINSLQSMIDDGVARGTKPIPWFATDGVVAPLFNRPKRGATDDFDPEDADRESFTAFKLPADARVGKLDPSAGTEHTGPYLNDRKAEWLRKFPEVSMWESLRERDVSGIAAEILHGDTRNKVHAVRPSTDRQVEKATQMAITMAAIRQKGTWQKKTKTRGVFQPFDENSWENEQLNFEIDNRPLIPTAPLTEQQKGELADIMLNKLKLPKKYVYEFLGVPKKVIDKIEAEDALGPTTTQGIGQQMSRVVDPAQSHALALMAGQNGQNGGRQP